MDMIRKSLRWFFRLFAVALGMALHSRAITISSGPIFTPATNAPLAGTLQVTTDVSSRVSVQISDGTNTWQNDFYDNGTNHSETLLGFRPGRTHLIQVTVYDQDRNSETASQRLTFVTTPLPSDFPAHTVLKSVPSMMEPGYTLFLLLNRDANSGYATIMDNVGEVVWYWRSPANLNDDDIRQLDNGDLFIVQPLLGGNSFLEINMLGQTVRTWSPPAGYPIDLHDGVPTDHGTILYLSDVTRSVTNFPVNYGTSNSPLGTVNIEDTPAVEISATNSALLNVWSPVNLLEPTRVSYLTAGSPYGIDNEHGNAVIEDASDDSIIVSLRNQNAVFKVCRTGQLKWILGPPANWGTNFQQYLLAPVGTPFEWNYGQHAPMLTPQGTLVLYDDGNDRASPWDPPVADQDNFSRGVEYSINETNLQVSQVWDSTLADEDRLYTPAIGAARWLPSYRNILVTYGYVTYINGVHPSAYSTNASMARIVEYTHDPIPQVVFDLSFFDTNNVSSSYKGSWIYRSNRIPDLYSHQPAPVTDLVLMEVDQLPALKFSADPVLTYEVQASTDLKSWTTIGTAAQDGSIGQYEFDDLQAGQYTARFYRVVTTPSQ